MGKTTDRTQLIEIAKHYWCINKLSADEIAVKVGKSARTVARWAKEGKWNELQTSILASRQEQLLNLHKQLVEINTNIGKREEGERYASPSEALQIQRISSAIKKLETEDADVTTIISVLTKYLNWLRPVDAKLAQSTSDLFDAFIHDNLK